MSGWKLTPRESTPEMDRPGAMEFAMCRQRMQTAENHAADVFRAMHEAAPSPPEDVLERMARAMCRVFGKDPDHWQSAFVRGSDSEQRCARNWERYIPHIRAALAAAEGRKDD